MRLITINTSNRTNKSINSRLSLRIKAKNLNNRLLNLSRINSRKQRIRRHRHKPHLLNLTRNRHHLTRIRNTTSQTSRLKHHTPRHQVNTKFRPIHRSLPHNRRITRIITSLNRHLPRLNRPLTLFRQNNSNTLRNHRHNLNHPSLNRQNHKTSSNTHVIKNNNVNNRITSSTTSQTRSRPLNNRIRRRHNRRKGHHQRHRRPRHRLSRNNPRQNNIRHSLSRLTPLTSQHTSRPSSFKHEITRTTRNVTRNNPMTYITRIRDHNSQPQGKQQRRRLPSIITTRRSIRSTHILRRLTFRLNHSQLIHHRRHGTNSLHPFRPHIRVIPTVIHSQQRRSRRLNRRRRCSHRRNRTTERNVRIRSIPCHHATTHQRVQQTSQLNIFGRA